MQRILFKKGKQREFLNLAKINLNCVSLKGILQYGFDLRYSTLKNYNSEKLLLPRDFFEEVCYIAKINPDNLDIKYIDKNWGQVIGGKKGIKVVMKKYPKEIKGWRLKGAKNSSVIGNEKLKKIKIPKLDEGLAEFIGVYLGDGTLTRYQLVISGDSRYDYPYYEYLSKLIYKLFGIGVSIRKEKNHNTLLLTISSKNVCSFLQDNFNLNYGHKIINKSIIPEKILNDEKLSIACLRGLIDTDGAVSRRGRNGSQFCIQFTAHNKLLLDQVNEIGKKLGIFTFCDKTGAGTNKWKNILRYFEIVGSSNLRHIVRFDLRNKGKTIYRYEVSNYFRQDLYRNMNLPFKIKGPMV